MDSVEQQETLEEEKAGENRKAFEGEKPLEGGKPWRFVRFIVEKPMLALAVLLLPPLLLTGIAMPKFAMNDLQGWDVSSSRSSKAFDSYFEAVKDWEAIAAISAAGDANFLQSVRSGQYFDIYFLSQGSFDLGSFEILAQMRAIENEVQATVEFKRSCLLQNTSNEITCVPPASITDYANLSSKASFNRSQFISNLKIAKEVASPLVGTEFDFESANEASPIRNVRTKFLLGLPREGFSSATDRVDEQDDEIDTDLQSILETVDPSISGVDVIFDFLSVSEYYAFKSLAADGAFAAGSIIYVGIFIGVHTGSLFMAIVGEMQILLSFPTTYFFYRFVFGIEHFGTLQVLAIFVILGIGADDIFVFFDAYRQSKVILTSNASTIERMQWAYKKASLAMALTSITTFAAFIVTSINPIMNVRVFGVFASLLVMINYIMCITILPTLIIIHERYVQPYRTCRCWCCCPENNLEVDTVDVLQSEISNLGKVEIFYRDRFSKFVIRFHKILVFLLVAVAVSMGYIGLTKLSPSDKLIDDIFADDHPYSILRSGKQEKFQRGTAANPTVSISFGLNPFDRSTASAFDPREKGEFSYNEEFNLTLASAQIGLLNFCDLLANQSFIVEVDCWVKDWQTFANQSLPLSPGAASPSLAAFTQTLQGQVHVGRHIFLNYEKENKPMFVIIDVVLDVKIVDRIDKRLTAIRRLEGFISTFQEDGLGAAMVALVELDSYLWWETQEKLVQTSQIGLISGLGLGLVILILATRNIVVALLSITSIVGVVCCVLGTMVLVGWELGFMESISVVCLVGLAIDYVVHLAIAYVEFEDSDVKILPEYSKTLLDHHAPTQEIRNVRTQVALTRLGVSISAGAVTTMGAAFFLLLCAIKNLGQFGAFLVMVIFFSLIMSHFLLPPLLVLAGPTSFSRISKVDNEELKPAV